MSRYISEKYQLGIVLPYLEEKGYQYTTEADLYSIPVDIIGAKEDVTVAVELKSKDFTRGVEQAKRNLSFVDHSYLAMWEERIPERAEKKLNDSKIGLLSVNSDVECLSSPRQSSASEYARKRVLDRINDDIRKQSSLR